MDPNYDNQYGEAFRQKEPVFQVRPARNRDVVFGLGTLMGAMVLANVVIEGELNLGYAVGLVAMMVLNVVYLGRGLRWNGYGIFHLGSAVCLAAGFAWSDDGIMKLLAYLGMVVSWYQALVLLGGADRWDPGTIGAVFDCCLVSWGRPMKELGMNVAGLFYREENGVTTRRKTGSVMAGVACAVPVLVVLLPLLMRSDAAFEGLMDKTIFADLQVLFLTLVGGTILFFPLYSRGVSLSCMEKVEREEKNYAGHLPALSVNSFLCAISFFYVLYLVSQLAYFFSGFAGILPEGYTASDYARRGFFEMFRICAINFGIIALSAGLVKRGKKGIPMGTRVLCLFVCLFSLVLVAASGSKMSLYIGIYGLTRLRVLTSVFMLCLGIAVTALAVWLLRPRFPYMKVILTTALILGVLTLWADVDTQVAKYNVESYRSGRLAAVDLDTLENLGGGSTEYIALLLDDPSGEVANEAARILARRCRQYYNFSLDREKVWHWVERETDFRGWNFKNAREQEILSELIERLAPHL